MGMEMEMEMERAVHKPGFESQSSTRGTDREEAGMGDCS